MQLCRIIIYRIREKKGKETEFSVCSAAVLLDNRWDKRFHLSLYVPTTAMTCDTRDALTE